jgi:hypothetical protein
VFSIENTFNEVRFLGGNVMEPERFVLVPKENAFCWVALARSSIGKVPVQVLFLGCAGNLGEVLVDEFFSFLLKKNLSKRK